MPNALAIGVSYETFWHLTPKKLNAFYKAHEIRRKEQDYFAWLSNQYTMSAVSVAISHSFMGRKSQAKYIEKPFLEAVSINKKLTEDEKQKEVDLFFARENARRVNWKRSRKMKNKELNKMTI